MGVAEDQEAEAHVDAVAEEESFHHTAKVVLSEAPRQRSAHRALVYGARAQAKGLQGDRVGAAADARKAIRFTKMAQPRDLGNQKLSKPMKKTRTKSPLNKRIINDMLFDQSGTRIGKDSSIEP